MGIAERRVALVIRIVAMLLAAWGILRNAGVFDGEFYPRSFLYFTVLSNLLALVWFTMQAVRTAKDIAHSGARGFSSVSPRFGAAVMFSLSVTMLIYLVVLIPLAGPDYVPFSLTDDLIHVITPCLTIIDWLLFTRKGHLRWGDPFAWVLIPYAYLVLAYIYSGLGGRFSNGDTLPYPFMNPDTWGTWGVVAWIAALTVALMIVGYIYNTLDHALWRVGRRRLTR